MATSSNYYENMSEIKESIMESYQMSFDNPSKLNSNKSISEQISYSKTNKLLPTQKQQKQSGFALQKQKRSSSILNQNNTNSSINKPQTKKFDSQKSIIEKQNQNDNKNKDADPIYLGDNIFACLKERYLELNKLQTSDPNVLYDFFLLQRKNFNPKKSKTNSSLDNIAALMPSSQRKLLNKIQFEKILTYYPQDVYYSLCCGAQKCKKDLELQHKANLLKYEMKKAQPKDKKLAQQCVNRLYSAHKKNAPQQEKNQSKVKSPQNYSKNKQQIQAQRRSARGSFGRKLSQVFQNNYRANPDKSIQTAQKLFDYWSDMYEREEYGIQWEQDQAQDDIKQYMCDQVQELQRHIQRKLGFKQTKISEMIKFYQKYKPLQNVHIPISSLVQYVKIYNQIQNLKQEGDRKLHQQTIESHFKKEKERQLKKFGRPVSATPITVLSKPKSANNFDQLTGKYATDKLLKTFIYEQQTKKRARKPFQYGIFDMQQEVKTKNRIKPNQKEKFDETVSKMLMKTFQNTSLVNQKNQDRVMIIMGEQKLQKDQQWKRLGPILHQAMLVKSYNQKWFRDSIQRYAKRILNKDFKLDDDKTLFSETFKYLDQLNQDDRQNSLADLDNVIITSQNIHQKSQQIKKLQYKGQNYQKKQQRLFDVFLQKKACQYIEKKKELREKNTLQQFCDRTFFNQMFKEALQQHTDFTIKNYRAIKGQKQCPKLLKYEFYRIHKQINPSKMERDQNPKPHAWFPTKNMPQSFNYKSFNNYAQVYKKDKNKIVAKRQRDQMNNTLWGRKKGKQRQLILMSYDDAKQCYFHPKISKQV